MVLKLIAKTIKYQLLRLLYMYPLIFKSPFIGAPFCGGKRFLKLFQECREFFSGWHGTQITKPLQGDAIEQGLIAAGEEIDLYQDSGALRSLNDGVERKVRITIMFDAGCDCGKFTSNIARE